MSEVEDLLRSDPGAKEQVKATGKALKASPPDWLRQDKVPDDLIVLRDWLIEHDHELPLSILAAMVTRLTWEPPLTDLFGARMAELVENYDLNFRRMLLEGERAPPTWAPDQVWEWLPTWGRGATIAHPVVRNDSSEMLRAGATIADAMPHTRCRHQATRYGTPRGLQFSVWTNPLCRHVYAKVEMGSATLDELRQLCEEAIR